MKTALLVTLSSLVLFAFLTNLPLVSAEEPVLDYHGVPVSKLSEYYILPISGSYMVGGGVRLDETGKSTCPVTVLQDYVLTLAEAVKFHQTELGPISDFIFPDHPLDIEFITMPDCAESSKWVVFFDDDILKPYVGITLPEEHRHAIKGTFKIQKSNNAYKLVFCVGNSLSNCFDIETYDNNEGGRRLIPAKEGEPCEFNFIKAGIRSVV